MRKDSPPDYTILDPREVAAKARFTYYLPSAVEIEAIGVGDLVKLVFEYLHDVEEWGAERMWVKITAISDTHLTGQLDNQPYEPSTSLAPDDEIQFHRFNVIDIMWDDPATAPAKPERREYWDRCIVDGCVLDGSEPVEYLYREKPEPPPEDEKDPDSGWRIRGRFGDASDAEIDNREAHYVALGAVLNRDDSWLHLLDEPIGSSFIRDFDSGDYKAAD